MRFTVCLPHMTWHLSKSMRFNTIGVRSCWMAVGSLLIVSFLLFFRIGPVGQYLGSRLYFKQSFTYGKMESTYRTTEPAKKTVMMSSSVTCPGLTLNYTVGEFEGNFQKLLGYDAFLYSAHLDMDNDVVEVISIRRITLSREGLMCQGWYQGRVNEELKIVEAVVQDNQEHHSRRYTASILTCKLPSKLDDTAITAVSIVTKKCESPSNVHQITPTSASPTWEFTVCIAPLMCRYNMAYDFVEMIELNKILGAEHFVLYNYSIGFKVDKVLEYYEHKGTVEILPWNMPLKTDTCQSSNYEPEIHYFGQMAAMNDCLLRHRYTSKYIVFQDIDEFIVPKNYANWTELMHSLVLKRQSMAQRSKLEKTAAYVFKNVFFRKEWSNLVQGFIGNKIANKYNSVVLRHILREKKEFPYNQRSKYIVVPKLTRMAGVHFPWEFEGNIENVPSSEAFLHHYRNWENYNEKLPVMNDTSLVDKFGLKLVQNLEKTWHALKDIPLDIDLKSSGDVS